MKDNRYARKRQHKRELKKKHAVRYDNYDIGLDERLAKEEYARDLESGQVCKWQDPRNEGYTYWVDFSLSGSRSYAKYCTNRKIRSKYRDLIASQEFDHIMALRGSQYEKEYDYFWTIW